MKINDKNTSHDFTGNIIIISTKIFIIDAFTSTKK